MPSGGPRPGSGRPKGKRSLEAIAQELAIKAVQCRRIKALDKVFNAQLALARGCTYVYEIVETGEGKTKKSEHVLVTDPDRIKAFLDGEPDTYMFITTEKPDGKMIVDMLDRAAGKPTQVIEMTQMDAADVDVRELPDDDIDTELARLRAEDAEARAREGATDGEGQAPSVN
jgi:hypothetical protein